MASVHGNPSLLYVRPPEGNPCTSPFVVHETSPAEPRKPRLLDRVRAALRTRHYSPRTEEAYVAWIRRYILFHDKRHPAEMGAPEISRFLTALAVEGNVAASTQNQALSALLFLYGDVLEIDVPWLDDIVRAKRPQRLPVVLTRDEVRAILRRLEGMPRLMAYLMYGASRTWTSARTTSSCGAARETRTGSRCCLRRSGRIWPGISRARGNNTSAIFSMGPVGWSSRRLSTGNIRTRAANGPGNGFSLRLVCTWTG